MNILFICSRNQWRSPTAEKIFQGHQEHSFRSAGTSESARVKISAKLLDWADLIFVMEKKHKQILLTKFGTAAREKQILVLDIPDKYAYMHAELVDMLKKSVNSYLNA